MDGSNEGRKEAERKGKRVPFTLGLCILGIMKQIHSSNTGIFCASHVLESYLKCFTNFDIYTVKGLESMFKRHGSRLWTGLKYHALWV